MSDGNADASVFMEGASREFRKSLRHPSINYSGGWFFVTSQVARNKSIFGAIVGDRCVLNPFGEKVREYWLSLPAKYPELELDEFTLMPNHFHAIVHIRRKSTNREHHLGFLMGRFKGGTGCIYGKMRREGAVEDIGDHLWQFDYWDDLITSDEEYQGIRRYIRENPANWSRDRYGACTAYSFGNLSLLDSPKIAFVASQGYFASDLRMRRIWAKGEGANREGAKLRAEAHRYDVGRCDAGVGANQRAEARRYDVGEGAEHIVAGGFSRRDPPVVISTFTSAQEREALRRALAKKRRVIQVIPQGIPHESEMLPELLAACREGRALVISPQAAGSRLNKKVATWCNEYVIRNAQEVWVGDISPNGMLRAMLDGLVRGMGANLRAEARRYDMGEGANRVGANQRAEARRYDMEARRYDMGEGVERIVAGGFSRLWAGQPGVWYN